VRHVRRAELQALLVTPVLTAASDEQVPVELPVWPVQMDLSQRIASTVLKQTMGKRRRRMDQHKWHARQDMRARVGCASSARLEQCRAVREWNVSPALGSATAPMVPAAVFCAMLAVSQMTWRVGPSV
jgi:hypothetical protein